ncbi:MAG: hypothetical protein NTZ05_13625 [Chloroflexi bacterium]|nr:hypothetical protein [Chloroflexota bacterium]
MSDNLVQFIPSDPKYVPEAAAQETAVVLLQGWLPDADEIAAGVTEFPAFIDAGGNFETVRCPFCSTELLEWWPGAMDQAYASSFSDLTVTLPCCGGASSLNDLQYDWPQGFSRFVLQVRNPNRPTFDATELALIASVLGCQLRMIWTHH